MISVHRLISRLLLTDNFCWRYRRCSVCRGNRLVIILGQMKQRWFTPPKYMCVIYWNGLSLSITISSQIYSLCLFCSVQERNIFFFFKTCPYSLRSPYKRHSELQSLHFGESLLFSQCSSGGGIKSGWRDLGKRRGCQPPDNSTW